MKKTIFILCLILYLVSAWPLINREMPVKAITSARMWSVDDDGPADFNSIQEAVDNASSGDTIFVHTGTYYEHVFINKTITLVGENNNATIIDGNKTDNVLHIKTDNVTVENFAIRNSGMYLYSGILVDHSIGIIISNNNVMYNYEGIRLIFSENNMVRDNIISNNYDGVYVYSSDNNVFFNNTINSSSYYGVYAYSSNNNSFHTNTVLNNSFAGISLIYSEDNVVSGNIISNNYYGAYIYSSNYNTFFDNSLISNSYYGISLVLLSSNNIIYHNNFNNTAQAKSEKTNFWDYYNEGNYWSNYNGLDANIDGIGDTLYAIDATNLDYYPLMGMFSDFSVTKEGETYSVTAISNSTVSPFRFQIGTETGNKIIYFTTIGKGGTGFCRVKIPTALMDYPYIVVVGGEEITPITLNISSEAYAYLYFTYPNKNQTVTIISSKTLQLYLELLNEYLQLQQDLHDLNDTYYTLLSNNSVLQYNYTQLKSSFDELNNSYQKYLSDYSQQTQNFRNLTYIFVALTAILIVITVYLSRRSRANVPTRIKLVEEK